MNSFYELERIKYFLHKGRCFKKDMDVRARFSLILDKLKDEDVEVLLKIAEWLLEEYLTREDRELIEAEIDRDRAIWEKAHWKGDDRPGEESENRP